MTTITNIEKRIDQLMPMHKEQLATIVARLEHWAGAMHHEILEELGLEPAAGDAPTEDPAPAATQEPADPPAAPAGEDTGAGGDGGEQSTSDMPSGDTSATAPASDASPASTEEPQP